VAGDNFLSFSAQLTYPLRAGVGIGIAWDILFKRANNWKFFTAEFSLLHVLVDLEADINDPHTPAGQGDNFVKPAGIWEYFLLPMQPVIGVN
jgi:hypothetical protein